MVSSSLLEKPLVAIVGRPNVGKSSLFNALVGRRQAIVSQVAGTTRDRLVAEIDYMGRELLAADTGGLVPAPEIQIEQHIAAQVHTAVDSADAVVLVLDGRDGVTYADQYVALELRKASKPVVLVVNKIDNPQQEMLALEAHHLGLGDPIIVSALHRRGLDDILEQIVNLIPEQTCSTDSSHQTPSFAIVGRPNVGKSSFVNLVLGTDRSIVSEVAGTTRDALDSTFETDGREGIIIDTAGIRRRGAITPGIERYSVLRAIRAIDRSDVSILVLDATELATDQDLHVAGWISGAFKGAVIAINKWDLVEDDGRRASRSTRHMVAERLKFMHEVPVLFMSAMTGDGINEVLSTAFDVQSRRNTWVDARTLNSGIMDAIAKHSPPRTKTGPLKIYRVKQESVSPPTFVFYCNNPDRVHFSYERFLANTIRELFDFNGVPLRLEFRGRGRVHVIGQNRAKASYSTARRVH